MLPKTYLLGAPSDADPFGEGMMATNLVKGLRMCNANLHAPLPEHYDWFPGKASGMTALWEGQPSAPGSKKICAFHLGYMPEFSQIDPGGAIIRRGWRSVLAKCIKARAVTKRAVERVFKISVDTDGTDGTCSRCRVEGKLKRASGKHGLCDVHNVQVAVKKKALEAKEEMRWQASLSPEKRMAVTTSSRLVLDMQSSPSQAKAKSNTASGRGSRRSQSRQTSTPASTASK